MTSWRKDFVVRLVKRGWEQSNHGRRAHEGVVSVSTAVAAEMSAKELRIGLAKALDELSAFGDAKAAGLHVGHVVHWRAVGTPARVAVAVHGARAVCARLPRNLLAVAVTSQHTCTTNTNTGTSSFHFCEWRRIFSFG